MNVKSGFPLVLVLLAFLLALAGCGPAPFSDLIGVNLINGVDFSDPGWVADDQTGTYMSFQSASPAAYNFSPAYRLEILNLFKDGDFEASTVNTQPQYWSKNGPANATDVCTVVNDATWTYGNALSFSIQSPNDWISFDLAAGSTDGLQIGNTYLIRFSFRITNVNQFALSYNNGSVDSKTWTISVKTNTLLVFPPTLNPPDSSFLVGNQLSQYLSINTLEHLPSVTPTGRIDNIRMLRADIPCRIRYVVPFSQSGRPNLVPGNYTFSVYVKADPSVTPATPNRFPATGVSIAVDEAVNGTFIYGKQVAVAHPTDFGADWSQWTLVKGSFPATSIPSSSTPNASMLQLSITPTDVTYSLGKEDVGSILIAAPRLEFVP